MLQNPKITDFSASWIGVDFGFQRFRQMGFHYTQYLVSLTLNILVLLVLNANLTLFVIPWKKNKKMGI